MGLNGLRVFMKKIVFILVIFCGAILLNNSAYSAETKKAGGKVVQTDKPKKGDTVAVIKTNQGTMKAIIFTSLVTKAANNFVELAKQGKYTNVPFHRVIENFMIQGGDFTNKNGTGGYAASGPGTTIGDEYAPELTHIRGALAWAKTSMPNSIGSQFYIVHPQKGAHFLDHQEGSGPAEGYTVFGQVYEGLEVIDKIATSQTDAQDRPLSPQTIESVSIEVVQ